ncbi:hypothetical protein M427DRAFT_151789 [Gonapodya prolifera JEL478]|uniref:Uncharacterized protein n=1 Tax=Gonapodya prolifera (strain JEL478) TaxID=1344416 RepID=A0A139AUP4_GONPJ|nr:hypothetical protein M427DRAFT_151789 [Gonapodya prolifera JEL478]|eukprot:KXS20424.1 hypothetical protein M427DRAFT_151789 [Gonapodya prolifera JEL478]
MLAKVYEALFLLAIVTIIPVQLLAFLEIYGIDYQFIHVLNLGPVVWPCRFH